MELDASVDSWHGHESSDDPWWNESGWFGFAVPERRINGWFYFWHRPNMNLTAAGVALWDDVGRDRHDCLFYHWFPFNPLPSDGDQFSFTLANGMSMEMVEALKRYRLHFKDPECELELEWEGTVTPFHDALATPDSEDIGTFHYDQLGRVQGQIKLRGEHLDVDCGHVRDRSWGVRRPFPRGLRGGLDMGWAADGNAFVATMLTTEPASEDEASTEPLAYGGFVKDGKASLAVAGQRTTERGSDGLPTRITVDLQAADGETMHAEGTPRNCLHYDDLWRLDWMLTEWYRIEDSSGWGESQDMVLREKVRLQRRALLTERQR